MANIYNDLSFPIGKCTPPPRSVAGKLVGKLSTIVNANIFQRVKQCDAMRCDALLDNDAQKRKGKLWKTYPRAIILFDNINYKIASIFPFNNVIIKLSQYNILSIIKKGFVFVAGVA